ncbi:MAG: tRNA guanosine(15) transglycosylase TgtA [Euryarchaeota archaeon]|nr:tRNA guanosine(15) transglycosylase TgtA [Euryarchaeota archaeon]
MPISLELKDRAAAGRICRLETPHGTVTTPTLLPVLNPNIQLISAKEMRRLFGAEMVITNSYVIRKHDDLRTHALEKGVHSLIDWDGPVMTDSGTFQQYVYGDVEVAPDEIVRFQRDIGVDVGTILDVFSTPERSYEEAREDLEETVRRAELSVAEKGDMALATTVQGGVYPILREEAARAVTPFGDLFPIGGVVPLMERQRYADLVRVIVGAKEGLPAGKPVHLFGCGHPMVFPLAAALGCDLFDSSAYAKYARDGRMIFADGTRMLAEMEESECLCPVCQTTPMAELKRLAEPQRMRLLAEHNLHVSFAELRRVRQSIREGTLWELVEQRATAHPSLQDAMKVLQEEPMKQWLERHEPISGSRAYRWTGPHSAHRPLLHRLHRRLQTRYQPPPDVETTVVLTEGRRPFSAGHRERIKDHLSRRAAHFIVDSYLGPVPIELDHVYPFAQSIVPDVLDPGSLTTARSVLSLFLDEVVRTQVLADGDELEDWTFHTAEDLYADPGLVLQHDKKEGPGIEAWDLDRLRMRATADLQFGRGAAKVLLGPWEGMEARVRFHRSKRLDKVRNVQVEGDHVLSLRAADGWFSLTADGARRLHAGFQTPKLRVVVQAESATFNAEGKNVMAPFVMDMDPELRPGDDCLVVDPDDRLVAHGRVILAPHEVGGFQRGLAVRVREGLGT